MSKQVRVLRLFLNEFEEYIEHPTEKTKILGSRLEAGIKKLGLTPELIGTHLDAGRFTVQLTSLKTKRAESILISGVVVQVAVEGHFQPEVICEIAKQIRLLAQSPN